MSEHQATRTLVKSPPELWAECSDASSLTRHLDQFGEIKITRLDPETAVAWEGERVSGTVRLEPSGWGTRVTLTAAVDGDPSCAGDNEPEPVAVLAESPPAPVAPPEPAAPPEPVAPPDSVAPPGSVAPPIPSVTLVGPPARGRGRGRFARLLSFLASRPEPPPGPPAPALSGPDPAPVAPDPDPAPIALDPDPAPVALDPDPAPIAPDPDPAAVEPGRSRFFLPDRGDLEHPHPEAAPEPEVTSVVADLLDAEAALVAALDSLGQAHHRPFSRA